ncbi:hypothetical protein ACOMHN_043568 [Nucella lapillus]
MSSTLRFFCILDFAVPPFGSEGSRNCPRVVNSDIHHRTTAQKVDTSKADTSARQAIQEVDTPESLQEVDTPETPTCPLETLAHTPIRVDKLDYYLEQYPAREIANEISQGFKEGFKIMFKDRQSLLRGTKVLWRTKKGLLLRFKVRQIKMGLKEKTTENLENQEEQGAREEAAGKEKEVPEGEERLRKEGQMAAVAPCLQQKKTLGKEEEAKKRQEEAYRKERERLMQEFDENPYIDDDGQFITQQQAGTGGLDIPTPLPNPSRAQQPPVEIPMPLPNPSRAPHLPEERLDVPMPLPNPSRAPQLPEEMLDVPMPLPNPSRAPQPPLEESR